MNNLKALTLIFCSLEDSENYRYTHFTLQNRLLPVRAQSLRKMTGLFLKRDISLRELTATEQALCVPIGRFQHSHPHLQRHLDEADVTIHPSVEFNQAMRRSVPLLNAMNTYQLNCAAPRLERQSVLYRRGPILSTSVLKAKS